MNWQDIDNKIWISNMKAQYKKYIIIRSEFLFTRTSYEIRISLTLNLHMKQKFLTSPADLWIPIFFSNFNSDCCSNLLDTRNLHEQVKKAFCYQNSFWPFNVWINCYSDLKFLQILYLQPWISKVSLDH